MRKYVGANNRQQEFEQHGAYGYAVGFERLVDFIMRNTSVEQIDVRREAVPTYPRVVYEDGERINNQSVRERFELTKNDSSIASRIISDTMEAGLIKPADIETASKKYMTYIPYYG